MMNEAWIEQSLARLEALETQQGQYEAGGQVAPPEIVEEIQTLYEALDAAAGEDEAPAQPAAAPVAAAPTPFAATGPFAAAPAGTPVQHAAPAMMPSPMPSSDYDDYDDVPAKGKGGLLAVAAVAVLGLGAGGWYMTMGPGAEKKAAPPAPAGEPKVISASAVPEDTQEPQVAKGGEASRTLGTKFEEGAPQPSRPSGNRNGGNNRPRNSGRNRKKKDDGRKIKVDDARDPLAGVD